MYRRKLAFGAAAVAGLAATQIAFADAPSAPRAAAAQGGLAVTPSILETTARRGASGSVTITNSTGRRLRMTVRARPWRQARNGDVARQPVADARQRLAQRDALHARVRRAAQRRASRSAACRRAGSQYGALDVVGKPTRRRKGINVAYNLISSLRFNPTSSARRLRLGAGRAIVAGRGSKRALVPPGPQPRQHGRPRGRQRGRERVRRRPQPARSARCGSCPARWINLKLIGLSGMRRGSYTASVTLSQAGRNIISVTRSVPDPLSRATAGAPGAPAGPQLVSRRRAG